MGLLVFLVSVSFPAQGSESTTAIAQIERPVVSVDKATRYLDLNLNAHHYLEQDKRLTPLEAETRYRASEFLTTKSPHRNYGRSGSAVWFYLEMDVMESALLQKWVLELDYTYIEEFDIYLQESGSSWQNYFSKTTASKEQLRDFEYHLTYSQPLKLTQAGQHKLLLRVKTAGVSLVPLNLWNADEWQKSMISRNVFLAVFYGAFAVMLLYNFMLYVGTKYNVYLIYCVYLVTMVFYLSLSDGYFARVVPLESEELRRMLSVGSSIIATAAVGIFAVSFLQTKVRFPIKHKLIIVCLNGLACLAVINFTISTPIASNAVISIVPFFAVLLLVTTLDALLKGHKEARLFFLGWSVMFFSSIYTSVGMMGYIDYEFTLKYALHIGSAVEVILLSLALADRINTFKAAKERAEQAAKQELLNNNELLKESNRVKDEFIATVSHELRTPLNGIIGAIELARAEEALAQRERFDDLALDSSYKMNTIVDNMLVFSELLTGKPELQNETVELRQWFEQLTEDQRNIAREKSIDFTLSVAQDIPEYANVDKKKVGLIIHHLVDNAVKFTQVGGVKVNFEYDGSQLVLRVSDTGCGIEADLQTTVFESFRQADGSYSRNYGGLGIGLAIVSQLLQLLQGEVQVHSELGKGTEFIARVPQTKVSGAAVEEPSLTDDEIANANFNNRVLVVEDNPVNQKVLCAILRKLGCEVQSALNGIEAVAQCREQTFDIIFMDCQMPEMNGFEATLRIRQMDSDNQNIPIIAVTANATEADMKRCFQVGMNDFVKKPINKKAIVKQLLNSLKKAA